MNIKKGKRKWRITNVFFLKTKKITKGNKRLRWERNCLNIPWRKVVKAAKKTYCMSLNWAVDTIKTWKRAQKICKAIKLQYSIGCRYVGMKKQYMLKWEKRNNPKNEKGAYEPAASRE